MTLLQEAWLTHASTKKAHPARYDRGWSCGAAPIVCWWITWVKSIHSRGREPVSLCREMGSFLAHGTADNLTGTRTTVWLPDYNVDYCYLSSLSLPQNLSAFFSLFYFFQVRPNRDLALDGGFPSSIDLYQPYLLSPDSASSLFLQQPRDRPNTSRIQQDTFFSFLSRR
ncbi:uncharacterized protein BJX67DRAFT_96069 [Aspergillus lucknowensis]|uniref:Uncharacterized protein n=1 Tax=Aspergillus lucknowensis TaxID=176173 RepID=A0ABR4M5Y7_9EURO